ncbi:alpha-amylase family glycosyl hydrolase [Ruegeria hyattellae]|uniref:alpha-amylase family glycosyl hydrolase n=1 Tax=Ruegeria hyattellae TaxID=3233337 RepID=UPI00355AF627
MNAQMAPQPGVPVETASDWWRGGVIYQIYPRSFQDSNGDGIGDLDGITQRLEYVASLGVDAIWISPFFKSPMKDFGYDVSDYRDVDPMFGTLADFDALLARAHELGLKVMIDLVLSHTSDQHPWFTESRASRENPKSDWYVWADPKPDGTPPNNWLAIFGGSAWQWDARRRQYYLHNFLTSQPDLNFHEPQVQEALLDVARFWLDRGVDGFRLDTINFYFHDKELRDNPPLPLEDRNDSIAPQVNPYNHQDHLYSKSQPENLAFLERLRALTDAYDARACLGEVGDAQRGLEIMGQYTAGAARMHMCYAFEFLEGRRATAAFIAGVFDDLEAAAPDGWACWAFSNHDVKRHASRWGLSDAALRCYTTLMMCLRGSVCLYQGEELGLPEADVSFEDLQDPYGIEFWPEFKGRDGCRTPMVWQSQAENAGFGNGKSWLPVSSVHAEVAVDRQEQDPGAMLHHYRGAIALRGAHTALQTGTQTDLRADGDLLSFTRANATETLFCAFNLGDGTVEVPLPDGSWQSVRPRAEPGGQRAVLGAWDYLIVKQVRN